MWVMKPWLVFKCEIIGVLFVGGGGWRKSFTKKRHGLQSQCFLHVIFKMYTNFPLQHIIVNFFFFIIKIPLMFFYKIFAFIIYFCKILWTKYYIVTKSKHVQDFVRSRKTYHENINVLLVTFWLWDVCFTCIPHFKFV